MQEMQILHRYMDVTYQGNAYVHVWTVAGQHKYKCFFFALFPAKKGLVCFQVRASTN
jgi:hypothetical protein